MTFVLHGNTLELGYRNKSYPILLYPGIYLFELFGSSGGGSMPGFGAYVSGTIRLDFKTKLYAFVGQKGVNGNFAAFNGGGEGNIKGGSGGGATDIRLINGNWDDLESLKSRIIVAGAGGGSQQTEYLSKGGDAGILTGKTGSYSSLYGATVGISTGGTQTSGGSPGSGTVKGDPGEFGKGGKSGSNSNSNGGGSGYFGGAGGTTSNSAVGSGGGGSSYVSGLEECKAYQKSSSYHSSWLYFTNITTKDGSVTSHDGDGKVTITLITKLRCRFISCRTKRTFSDYFVVIISLNQ